MNRPDPLPAEALPAFIDRPLGGVAAWVAAFDGRDIPVLASTAQTLQDLAENEDAVDAHLLAEPVAVDPLMTLKLLRHVAALRAGRDQTDPETATEALVMLGITPFFRAFRDPAVIETRLAGHPAALEGLRRVLRRAHRAAQFALGFAVHRQDYDAALIHEATLLHDFAELLMWAHAPGLCLTMARRQRQDPDLRSGDVQQAVLGITLADLQQALMKAWRLPALLVTIADDHDSELPQVRNVQLAIRFARHSAEGWGNPALPDDVQAIADLLNLGNAPTLQLLHRLNS